jgi:hypothetical protein
MTGGESHRIGTDGGVPPGGTVVAHPFRTTVPRNDSGGTVERFWPKCRQYDGFSSYRRWNGLPFESGALAPLSGRSVPLLSLGETSGTGSRQQVFPRLPADGSWRRWALGLNGMGPMI